MGQVDIEIVGIAGYSAKSPPEMHCFLCSEVMDARRIGKRLLARCKCGVRYEPSDKTVEEAIEHWIKTYEKRGLQH